MHKGVQGNALTRLSPIVVLQQRQVPNATSLIRTSAALMLRSKPEWVLRLAMGSSRSAVCQIPSSTSAIFSMPTFCRFCSGARPAPACSVSRIFLNSGNCSRSTATSFFATSLDSAALNPLLSSLNPYFAGPFSKRLSASIALPKSPQFPCCIAFWASSNCAFAWPKSGCPRGACAAF